MWELSQLDVLVVDCQTTGASPALGAVLELGWGVVRASEPGVQQLQAHWVALPEGHVVSRRVRLLTGFDERCRDGALSPQEIWERLRASMSDRQPMPAAIHFARFELAFLRDWSKRFAEHAPFPIDAVCVHALACRLYPDLPRRSLRALAGFLGHSVDLTRCSEGHVEATAFIWRKLSAELERLGVGTWADLQSWLAGPRPTGPRLRKRRYPMPSAQYRALADRPGVYHFMRSNGDLLYVGKAASVRKRVASHFTAGSRATERALEMLTQVHHVDVTHTATALEAALLENESIKTLRPPYNVQLTINEVTTWFASPGFESAAAAPSNAHPHGPLPSLFSARALGAVLALSQGAPATRGLSARSVGAADAFAPDAASFADGWRSFVDKHLTALTNGGPIARAQVIAAAKRLLRASNHDAQSSDGNESLPNESSPRMWDAERVTRHLERAVAQSYQLVRRAKWLCLLYDSVIAYREPGCDTTRLLIVESGRALQARDLTSAEALPMPRTDRSTRARQGDYDRARYDAMRTLLTELKRVRRDGGSVTLRVGRGRILRGTTLDGLLWWV